MHMAPNSNGLLRRWGITAEGIGATNTDWLREFRYTGGVLKEIPLFMANKRWQHPWQLVHRVALHDKLKKLATEEGAGVGPPARLHTSSTVVDIDPEKGIVTLESGETISADLVVGADGIYVSCGKYEVAPESVLLTPRSPVRGSSSPAKTQSFSARERLRSAFYSLVRLPWMTLSPNH